MFYIYQFLNESEEVIYIGITNNIKTRIQNQHFGKMGHLPDECYEEAFMILHSECVSEDDAKIKERYLINKFAPKYNSKLNNNSRFNFEINDFKWKYLPINKTTFLEKKSEIPTLTISNVDVEYKIKILNEKSIRLVKRIPCKATRITEIKTSFQNFALSVLFINGDTWVFYDQVQKAYSYSPGRTARQLLNSEVLDTEDVCLIEDEYAIRDNIDSAAIESISGRKIWPKNVFLIKVQSIQKVLEHLFENDLDRYIRELKRKGVIKHKDNAFYSIDEFVQFSKTDNSYVSTKIRAKEKLNRAFSNLVRPDNKSEIVA